MTLTGRVKAFERGLEKLTSKDYGGPCPRCGKPEGPADLDSREGVRLVREWLQASGARTIAGEEPEDFEAYYLARFCGCHERGEGEK